MEGACPPSGVCTPPCLPSGLVEQAEQSRGPGDALPDMDLSRVPAAACEVGDSRKGRERPPDMESRGGTGMLPKQGAAGLSGRERSHWSENCWSAVKPRDLQSLARVQIPGSQRLLSIPCLCKIEASLTHNVMLVSGAQHGGRALCSEGSDCVYNSTIFRMLYHPPFIRLTYSFQSWKPGPPTPLHPFCLPFLLPQFLNFNIY